MMRIRLTIPGEPTAETLGIALEAATRLAQHDVANGAVPDIEQAISEGLEWAPEPPGDESFDKPTDVYQRGWGDCDDLAPWLAAEMRETGYDTGATSIAVPSGPQTWHALVKGSDGTIYDPSVWAGMPHTVSGVAGSRMPVTRPINVGKLAVVIGQTSVRVDVPGLRSRLGCRIGVCHECKCNGTDEDRVFSLIKTIEDALAKAELARTGDTQALKSLAVIYRVLRGDDPDHACEGVRIGRHQVGMNFDDPTVRKFIQNARAILATAADEIFNGETWTTQDGHFVKARKVAVTGHRVGFIPCLIAAAPIIEAAATAGTIAAVAQPLAEALEKMIGADTDFGKFLKGLDEVLGDVKLVSAAASGIEALASTASIPIGAEAIAARWYETLRSPLEAAGLSDASTQDVAKAVGWAEGALAKALPPDVATRIAPELVDIVKPLSTFASSPIGTFIAQKATKQIEDLIVAKVKDALTKQGIPPGFQDVMAESQMIGALKALANNGEPAPFLQTALQAANPADAASASAKHASRLSPDIVSQVEQSDAEKARDDLRTVPIAPTVPTGWDPIFALGCRQVTGQCQ